MKKSVKCYYKDGSLIFITTSSYPYPTAHKIRGVFNVLGLVSSVSKKSNDLFDVVGRLYVNYDPFNSHAAKWEDVIIKLSRMKATLEDKLRIF
ncbi:hypothetical protein [Dyadobacter sandarakinus]|uniref:Uncharacterized protein n=1 Tax=Dyadobacter sandarakinus TaxID=2747268 RepID=A0ABX7I1L4_9BACT|nr:hypothetical protein [Dyadobacter sandarakinus]QRQ99933.1 hypothetical protein HWI92_02885 [Dyadobacter sandarakinus]